MALNNNNNDTSCKCTTPEYEIVLNEQGPQGRQGEKGDAGFTPIISVKDNTASNYTLNILTQDGQITTPNLKANLPAGGATGQVLTKNSANQDDCSWQNLPQATQDQEGTARLATENDFEETETSQVSNNSIVTPELFNSEFKKQSAKFVTTDTQQNIDASKTFSNGINVYNNLSIPYNSSSQNGKIVTNASVNNVRIPIIEPYDTNGSFRIGAVKEEASEDVQNGFDINNDLGSGAQGVTYYEVGQKGKLVASFNIDKYVKAGDNVTIDKGSDGSLTINSTGGGSGTSDYTQLTNKPQINGHELTGNQDGTTLGLANEQEVEELGNELSELANTVSNKQNKLTAGEGITISEDNVISASTSGNYIPTQGNVSDLTGIKTFAEGGIGLNQPLGSGIYAGGVLLYTYYGTRVGSQNYFNPIIGSSSSKYTQINSPILKNSAGTKYVVQTDYATTTTGGTVKVDGTTITIKDGVISAVSGGSDVSLSGDNTFTGNNTFDNTITIGNDIITANNKRVALDTGDGVALGDANGLTTIYSNSDIKAIINGGTETTVTTALDLEAVTDEVSSTTDIVSSITKALNDISFWKGPQTAYDAIKTKDDNTLYIITG